MGALVVQVIVPPIAEALPAGVAEEWVWYNSTRFSGTRITINELARLMGHAAGIEPRLEYGPPRKGDVRHSLADVAAAGAAFAYRPTMGLAEGLREYMQWAKGEL